MTSSIQVLLVDDDAEYAKMSAEYLEGEADSLVVRTASDPERALERLETAEIDCIVSDYQMPGMDGLEFFEAVREEDPELPFILYTGKGSEEIASEAISQGVTDYLQKGFGTDQYTVLANRVQNAAETYRAQREIDTTLQWYETLLEQSADAVVILDETETIQYVSPSIERVLEYSPAELTGESPFQFIHPDDRGQVQTTLEDLMETPDQEETAEFRVLQGDGTWRWIDARGRNALSDPVIEGIVVNGRDITERKRAEQKLHREVERLEEFASIISHDLRNPLNIARGQLHDLKEGRGKSEQEILETIDTAHERIEEIIENVLTLVRQGESVSESKLEAVVLAEMVEGCWETIETDEATLEITDDVVFQAAPEQLRHLLENLIENAVTHGGSDVTIRVGVVENGFYVADDGPGIPEENRDRVFESGYSDTGDGSGFGLRIVEQVANAHGWEVTITESQTGGARFEITGLQPVSG